jgi:hypothetical protein
MCMPCRSYEDVYGDPGTPLTRRTSAGTYILAKVGCRVHARLAHMHTCMARVAAAVMCKAGSGGTHCHAHWRHAAPHPHTRAHAHTRVQVDGKRQLLMSGQGASPEGSRPFLDLLDLDTKQAQRLWQSSPPFLESVGSIMSDNNDVSAGRGETWAQGRQAAAGWRRAGPHRPLAPAACVHRRARLGQPPVAATPHQTHTHTHARARTRTTLAAHQDAPITLDGLQLLLSRESAKEPPQTYLISFSGSSSGSSAAGGSDACAASSDGAHAGALVTPQEQQITNFPHPYPQVRYMPCAVCCMLRAACCVLHAACCVLLRGRSLLVTSSDTGTHTATPSTCPAQLTVRRAAWWFWPRMPTQPRPAAQGNAEGGAPLQTQRRRRPHRWAQECVCVCVQVV